MYTNRLIIKTSRMVSFCLVLILVFGNGLVGSAAQAEPTGAIAGTISLPPEAQNAQLHFSTEKTGLSSKMDTSLKAMAEAAKISTQKALEQADAAMARRSGERVQIQALTTPDRLEDARIVIEQAGGQITGGDWSGTTLQGWLPISALEGVAANPMVDYLRLPEQVSTFELDAGTYTTEGLAAINGPAWHSAGFLGLGVKVAIIDAGFQGYPGLLGSDLPATVTVKNFVDGETDPQVDGTTVHGAACAEIVYDIAPQATMYLAKVGTDIDLQEAVDWAKSNGVDVISTSLGWYNLTPGDGTGFFADLVQDARNNGILWATAASNDRQAHWGGAFSDPNGDSYHQFNGDQRINYFGPGNGDAYLINPGFAFRVFLRWDDWANHNQDYDLLLLRYNGSTWDTVASSANNQNGGAGQTPTEYAAYVTSGDPAPYGFAITRYSSNRNVNLEIFAPKIAPLDELVYARSLANLADSPGAMTVAALDVNSPYPQETYSSEGPTNGPGGTAAGGFIKPDISGFANVSTVSYGTVDKFNGTSSATPHVAGAAALLQSAYPSYTPAQIETLLTGRAIDMGAAGKDTVFGYGRLYLGSPNATFTSFFLPLVRRDVPPTAPTNLAAVASSSSVIHLTWDDNASSEAGYNLERSPNGSTWSPLITLPANTTSHDDTGLQANTPYYYRVKAYNSAGSSAYSNPANATTLPSGGNLCNGNFEQGNVCWTEYSTHGWTIIMNSGWPTGVTPHGGSWAAWLGGDINDTSYIQQQVTVAAGTPYLAYYHWIASEDACGYDVASVRINGTPVQSYDLCSGQNTGGWVKHVVNLSAYANQSVTLQIRVVTDSSNNSNLFVDDMAFQASASSPESGNLRQDNPAQWLPRAAIDP